jgi:chromosome segregation ATPase
VSNKSDFSRDQLDIIRFAQVIARFQEREKEYEKEIADLQEQLTVVLSKPNNVSAEYIRLIADYAEACKERDKAKKDLKGLEMRLGYHPEREE